MRLIKPRRQMHEPAKVQARELCRRLGPGLCPYHGTVEGLCAAGDQPCVRHTEIDVRAALVAREARYDAEGRELHPAYVAALAAKAKADAEAAEAALAAAEAAAAAAGESDL